MSFSPGLLDVRQMQSLHCQSTMVVTLNLCNCKLLFVQDICTFCNFLQWKFSLWIQFLIKQFHVFQRGRHESVQKFVFSIKFLTFWRHCSHICYKAQEQPCAQVCKMENDSNRLSFPYLSVAVWSGHYSHWGQWAGSPCTRWFLGQGCHWQRKAWWLFECAPPLSVEGPCQCQGSLVGVGPLWTEKQRVHESFYMRSQPESSNS